MIRVASKTLTRIVAVSLALGLVGGASAAPVLVIGRTTPALSHVAALESLRGLPGLTQDKGLSVARAYGEDDEDCLATTRPDGSVSISCAR